MSLNEALIAAVQKRQALYDKTDDNYSNYSVFIARQWQEIGKEIGMDDQGARKKWTTLRDYFQKTHRQLTTTRSGSGADKQKKWYLYDSLLFLLPHIGDRATCSKLSPEQQEEESESVLGIESPRDRNHTPSRVPTTASTSTQSNEAQPLVTPRPRKRKFPQERYTINPVDEIMLDTITSIGDKLTQKEAPDEDELFCKSLVSKIRSLDPFSKMECQAEFKWSFSNT